MCCHNVLGPKPRKMVSHLPCCSRGKRVALERLQTPLTDQHFHSWNWFCTTFLLTDIYLLFSNTITFKIIKKINKQKKRWELHHSPHFPGIPHMDKQGCLCPRHNSIPLPLKPLEYPHKHIPNLLLLETLMEPYPSRQIKPKQQEILFSSWFASAPNKLWLKWILFCVYALWFHKEDTE